MERETNLILALIYLIKPEVTIRKISLVLAINEQVARRKFKLNIDKEWKPGLWLPSGWSVDMQTGRTGKHEPISLEIGRTVFVPQEKAIKDAFHYLLEIDATEREEIIKKVKDLPEERDNVCWI